MSLTITEFVSFIKILLSMGEMEKAKKYLKVFESDYPKSPEGLSLRGTVLRHSGQTEEGDKLILEAIELKSQQIKHKNLSLEEKIVHFENILFLGGNIDVFFIVGRMQLDILKECGLLPKHRILDIGCGCLRGGLFVTSYLDKGNYHGIEPNKVMASFGLKHVLGPQIFEEKEPQIDHNSDYNFGVFDVLFDYCIARSIWTHCSRAHIEKMLDQFLKYSEEDAVFLASYLPVQGDVEEYKGEAWIGRSHVSEIGGFVHHSFDWIKSACSKRGLSVVELLSNESSEEKKVLNAGQQQVWLKIMRFSHSSKQ